MPLLTRSRDASLGQLPTYGAIFRGGLAYIASLLGALLTPMILGLARVLLLGGLRNACRHRLLAQPVLAVSMFWQRQWLEQSCFRPSCDHAGRPMIWYANHKLAFLMYVPAALAGLLATQVGTQCHAVPANCNAGPEHGAHHRSFLRAPVRATCVKSVSHHHHLMYLPSHVLQAAGCKVLRLDLSNSLLGMSLVLGGLAVLLTSLGLGSAFLFAFWALAALLGMPAAGRVSHEIVPLLPVHQLEICQQQMQVACL